MSSQRGFKGEPFLVLVRCCVESETHIVITKVSNHYDTCKGETFKQDGV